GDPAEAARGVPAQRVPARTRHARHGRRSARAQGGDRPRAAVRAGARRRARTGRAVSPGPGVDFLFSLERFGMKFGLANIAALCAALDHPERAFTSIHVAGTNGKGSVTAMVDAGLRAAGHHSARYTSPHLVRLEERFTIDG